MTKHHCHECGALLTEAQYQKRISSSNWQLLFVFGGTALLLISVVLWGAFVHPENCVPGSPCLRVRHLFIKP